MQAPRATHGVERRIDPTQAAIAAPTQRGKAFGGSQDNGGQRRQPEGQYPPGAHGRIWQGKRPGQQGQTEGRQERGASGRAGGIKQSRTGRRHWRTSIRCKDYQQSVACQGAVSPAETAEPTRS